MTDTVETLVLVLVYVIFIKNLTADNCYSLEAIENGKGSLEKLKVRAENSNPIEMTQSFWFVEFLHDAGQP
jgi:hypothetical protein